MTWTDTPPTVAGVYWYRAAKGQPAHAVEVWRVTPTRFSATGAGGGWRDLEDFPRGQWYGPLQPPEDAP